MSEAMIGLIAALGVVIVEKLADFISARVSHGERKKDKQEEKHDKALEDLKEIREIVESLGRKITDNQARECRIRMLRFEDEMRHEINHSKDHFEQILEDIDTYNDYCDKHPDFHNGIGHQAAERIKEVYAECVKNNSFI